MFALFLDVRSAFDSVQRKILINNLFHCGAAGDALLFIDNRLGGRTTFVEFEKILMGPIEDQYITKYLGKSNLLVLSLPSLVLVFGIKMRLL